MKQIFGFIFSLSLFLAVATPVNAQATSSGTTSGTLPATGVETPLLIIGGAGILLFASGFLFKKLQSQAL